jgi:hypothetical protein
MAYSEFTAAGTGKREENTAPGDERNTEVTRGS